MNTKKLIKCNTATVAYFVSYVDSGLQNISLIRLVRLEVWVYCMDYNSAVLDQLLTAETNTERVYVAKCYQFTGEDDDIAHNRFFRCV